MFNIFELDQKFFEHIQNFSTQQKIFWPCSKIFGRIQNILDASKYFGRVQKILDASKYFGRVQKILNVSKLFWTSPKIWTNLTQPNLTSHSMKLHTTYIHRYVKTCSVFLLNLLCNLMYLVGTHTFLTHEYLLLTAYYKYWFYYKYWSGIFRNVPIISTVPS